MRVWFDPPRTGVPSAMSCQAQSRVGSPCGMGTPHVALFYLLACVPALWTLLTLLSLRPESQSISVPWIMLPVLYHSGYCFVRASCEKPRSVPMQSHLGSVDVRGWVQSSFELLRDWWVKGETSAECIIYHYSLAQGHERPGSFFIRS